MASTYSSNLKIELIATGEQAGLWGVTTNDNFTNVFEQAIVGRGTANFPADADLTLTFTDSVSSQTARNVYLNVTSGVSLTQTRNLIVPTINKNYVVQNNTTGSQSIVVKTSAGTGITVPNGFSCAVYVDGTNVIQASNYFPVVTATQVNITGQGDLRLEDTTGGEYVALQAPGTLASSYTLTLPVDDGTNGQALITDGNGNLSWSTAASGDVYGPASATDNAVVRFDSTTGKLIKNSGVIIDNSNNVTGVADFTNTGNTTLGNASGDTLTITGTAVTTPNGLNFDSNTLVIDAANNRVGINETTPKAGLDVFVSANVNLALTKTGGAYLGFYEGTTHRAGINGLSAADGMVFTTGSGFTERMRIDSSGNVGIGTTAPQAVLDLGSGTAGRAITWGGTAGAARYTSIFSAYASGALVLGADFHGSTSTDTYVTSWTGTAAASGIRLNLSGTTGIQFFTDASAAKTAGNAFTPTERMRLDSAGNLGLGVTPSAWRSTEQALQIGTNSFSSFGFTAKLSSNAYWPTSGTATYVGTANATTYVQTSGQHQWYNAPSGTAGNAITFTQAMTLDASGNLLVGTTSNPAGYRVNITGTTPVSFNTTNNTSYAASGASTAIPDGTGLFTFNNNTAAADKFNGIVVGALGGTSAGQYSYWGAVSTASGFAPHTVFGIRSGTATYTERMRIDSSGNVQIGNTSTSAASERLNVNGFAGFGDRAATNPFVLVGNTGSGAGVVGTYSNHALEFRTNNSERMRITSAGDVGIGTSSPSYLLDVVGNVNGSVTSAVQNSNSGTSGFARFLAIANGGNAQFGMTSTGYTAITGAQDAMLFNSGGTSGGIVFAQEGVAQVKIDSSGNVGIGTSSPATKFQVVGGDIRVDAGNAITFGDANNFIMGNSPANTLRFYSNNAERMRIDSSGNVLVNGTVAAASTGGLTLNNSTSGSADTPLALRCSGTGNGSGSQISFRGVSNASAEHDYGYITVVADDTTAKTGSMRFSTTAGSSPLERMRITSDGNVLVNKTATNFTDSGLQLDNNSGNAGRVVCTKSASGSYSVFVNYHAGTYVGGIDMSNTATGFPTSSDIRLKKNIVDCPNALDKVNQMRIVSHDWKVDDSHVEYGVIAQELEPIAPQAVKKGDDGETVEQTWAVDYSKLVPILTKAIQEQQAMIVELTNRIKKLEGAK